MSTAVARGFGWIAIVRLGLVQAAIGAIVMLATSLLNRVMVVEYALAAAIPAGLVAWHYAVQLARPLWGHGSDRGRKRTPWIGGGMAVLAGGALLAVRATTLMPGSALVGGVLAVAAFAMIGFGVGAAGTSMLALLASGVRPERRAAAAAVTWTMMIAGIVIAAGVAGALLDPFSEARLTAVAGSIALAALGVALIAIWRIFVSMLAYSMKDLILEPFAGLVFGMTPGESTSLSGMQHGGVLIGMIVAGVGGSAFAGRLPTDLRLWIVAGCAGSGLALAGLAMAAIAGPGWPLTANVFALGLCNGVFAVSAIGAMMGLAGAGEKTREGVRMGVWGAAQAIAFGLGGLTGALGVDIARHLAGQDGAAFQLIFAIEACLFILAAVLAVQATIGAPNANRGVARA